MKSNQLHHVVSYSSCFIWFLRALSPDKKKMVENVTKKRFVCSLRSLPLFFVLQTEIPFFMKRLLISFLSFLLLGVKKFKWFDLLHPPFLFSLFRTFQTENPFLILVQRDCLLRHCRYLSELYFVITKKKQMQTRWKYILAKVWKEQRKKSSIWRHASADLDIWDS